MIEKQDIGIEEEEEEEEEGEFTGLLLLVGSATALENLELHETQRHEPQSQTRHDSREQNEDTRDACVDEPPRRSKRNRLASSVGLSQSGQHPRRRHRIDQLHLSFSDPRKGRGLYDMIDYFKTLYDESSLSLSVFCDSVQDTSHQLIGFSSVQPSRTNGKKKKVPKIRF